MNRVLKLLMLLICFSKYIAAQEKDFVFTHFTKDDKLLSNRVNNTFKDSKGFIWFATANGLQSYDGKRMRSFQHNNEDPYSLPGGEVQGSLEDAAKRLLVFTTGGACFFDPLHNRFIKIPIEFNATDGVYPITRFILDSKGVVWITMFRGGLFFLDTEKNIFRPYSDAWPPCRAEIHHIGEDAATGYYWLGTDSGLVVYNSKAREYYYNNHNPYGFSCYNEKGTSAGITAFHLDKNDRLWLVFWPPKENPHFFCYDIKANTTTNLGYIPGTVFGFLTDGNGTTWAFGESLSWYDKTKHTFRPLPKKHNDNIGADYDEIVNMFEDDEHNLWCSSNIGVYQFNPQYQAFNTVTVSSKYHKDAIDPNINNFFETNDGHIIALGWGYDGLYFYDTSFNRVPNLYGFDPRQYTDGNYFMCWSGLQDSRGLIWIGCQEGRIICIDPVNRKITNYHPPEFTDRTIRSMAEDKDGNIWMGTQNNVIVKWVRASKKFIQLQPAPPGRFDLHTIFSMLPGNDNDMWVASSANGLFHFGPGGELIEQFNSNGASANLLRSNAVQQLFRYDDNNILLATGGGIELFDTRNKQFTHVTERLGLMSDRITSITKDDQSGIWYSTVEGISKIDLSTKTVSNYGTREGITQNGFYPASIKKFRNGSIAFGNPRGFVFFKPGDIKVTDKVPDVRITSFSLFDKMLPIDSLFANGDEVALSYTQNFITIRFSAMSFLLNDKLDYYYMLEGIDKGWVKAGFDQMATYTYLPGGTYTFKIRCVAKNGVASKGITSFRIRITPPFWKRWWFYLLLAIIVCGIIYFIDRIRINRIRDMEKVRLRIARDLHDDMGSTLSTINILSAMAKTKITSDVVKTGEYIGKISDNSQRMMEAMDDIVWAIKPDNDSMQKIVARMREFATNVLEAKEIDLQFRVEEGVNEVKLNMEQRRDFFLVFKEAVNNVAKYSKCKNTTIQLGVHHQRLVLVVSDDGIGFDLNTADGGNGLGNMQKRAGAMKGRIQFQSKPGEGIQVTLNIPV